MPQPSWFGMCAVCRRRHGNLGWSPNPDRAPIAWACVKCATTCVIPGDPESNIVRKVYNMTDAKLDVYENKAIEAGVEAAGEYLDSIGETDWAKLDYDQVLECGRKMLIGYSEEMRTMMSEDKAPF